MFRITFRCKIADKKCKIRVLLSMCSYNDDIVWHWLLWLILTVAFFVFCWNEIHYVMIFYYKYRQLQRHGLFCGDPKQMSLCLGINIFESHSDGLILGTPIYCAYYSTRYTKSKQILSYREKPCSLFPANI